MLHKNWMGAGLVLAAVGVAGAHLSVTGLKPTAGETFVVGTSTAVEWTVGTLHDGKMDVDFSTDGGATWTTVKEYTASATGLQTFNWTPNAATTQGKIRICQIPGGGACTNAQNFTDPVNVAPYVLVTQAFTVTAVTGISGTSEANKKTSLEFHADTRNVDVSFGLESDGDVLLQAFDAQGHLLGTLLEGRQSAGAHKMSLFSNQLNTITGMVVFKLNAGDDVLTQSWNLSR